MSPMFSIVTSLDAIDGDEVQCAKVLEDYQVQNCFGLAVGAEAPDHGAL